MNKKKIILIAVAVVAVAGISIRLFSGSTAKHKVTYETATVIKGEISESITATGTIEPVTEVEVGTQVSGIIDKIYADYNSVVTKGQLIAEMDRVTLQSEVASQRAAYNGAKAEYEYQRKNYERNRGLHEKQLIGENDIVKDCESEHKLWTREGNTFIAHPVTVGISNGVNTEIVSGIDEGATVVTEATIGRMPGEGPTADMPQEPSGEKSPFMPGPPGSKKKNNSR